MIYRRVLITVLLCTLASLALFGLYVMITGAAATLSGWIFTALCPILVSGPASFYNARQNQRIEQLNADLKRAYDSLGRIASTDDLTGVASRRSFFEQARAVTRDGASWLIIADVDRFKSINDRFGHERGDAFLKEAARLMSSVAGKGGIVGRLGGEEFAIVLRRPGQEQAMRAAEAIRQVVADIALISDDGETIGTTISLGLTSCLPGDTLCDDLKRADAALYRAKGEGRDLVQFNPPAANRTHRIPQFAVVS